MSAAEIVELIEKLSSMDSREEDAPYDPDNFFDEACKELLSAQGVTKGLVGLSSKVAKRLIFLIKAGGKVSICRCVRGLGS